MERARQVRHEHCGQVLAASGAARPLGQVLEDPTRVVGPAEGGVVDAAAHPPLQARTGEHERGAEASAHHDAGRLGAGAKAAPEGEREVRRGRDAAEQEEPDEPPLHQQVSCAPAQEDRNLQHAVLHDRVGERQRDQEEAQHAGGPDPEGEVLVRVPAQVVGRGEQGESGEQSDQDAPQDHAALPPHGGRSARRIGDERHEAEREASEVIDHQRRHHGHDQAPGEGEERLAAAGHERPRRQGNGHDQAAGEPRRLQPGQPPVQRRRGREDGEEVEEERRPASIEEDLVGEEEAANGRSRGQLHHRRAGDEAREQQRQEPCIPILDAQEQHRHRHREEQDGVGADELLGDASRGSDGDARRRGEPRLEQQRNRRARTGDEQSEAIAGTALGDRLQKKDPGRERPVVQGHDAVSDTDPGPAGGAAFLHGAYLEGFGLAQVDAEVRGGPPAYAVHPHGAVEEHGRGQGGGQDQEQRARPGGESPHRAPILARAARLSARFALPAAAERRLRRDRLVPDVVGEPVEVVLEDGAVRLRLRDPVPEAGIDDHAGGHVLVAQPAVQLVAVRDRHPLVRLAVLD